MQKNVCIFLFHLTYLSIEEGKIISVFDGRLLGRGTM